MRPFSPHPYRLELGSSSFPNPPLGWDGSPFFINLFHFSPVCFGDTDHTFYSFFKYVFFHLPSHWFEWMIIKIIKFLQNLFITLQ